MKIDSDLFFLLNGLAGRAESADKLFSVIAQYLPYVIVAVLSVLWFLWKRDVNQKIRILMLFVLSMAFSYALVFSIIHPLWPRERPFQALTGVNQLIDEGGSSFPSLHAMFFFFTAAFVQMFSKKIGFWCFAAALVIGLSRIVVGVHYPLDVLVGALYGASLGFLAAHIGRGIKISLGRKPAPMRSYRSQRV